MWALLVGESVGNFRDIFPIFSSLKCIFTLTALHRCGSFFFHHVSHFCLYVFPGHWDNGGNLVWESSKHMLPKHMIIRFCWLFFFFRSNAMRDSMSHGWMEQRDGWGECRERAWKSKRELEKELCPVLLSCLSVAGGKEQRKLVGCGVSHVCLTLSDSLLCYSLALSVFTPGDVWLLCICPVFQPPLHNSSSFSLIISPAVSLCLPPPRYKRSPQRQVGSEQVEGRTIGRHRKKRMRNGGGRRPRTTAQERRSLQGQYIPHLSLGAREGQIGILGRWRGTHLSHEELTFWRNDWKSWKEKKGKM